MLIEAISFHTPHKPDLVLHSCNPRAQPVEAAHQEFNNTLCDRMSLKKLKLCCDLSPKIKDEIDVTYFNSDSSFSQVIFEYLCMCRVA